MTHPFEEPRSVFYQAFTRDGARCRYCGRDILESYDTFCASELDHLKPKRNGGADDDALNRVTACGVCNNLKGCFDPSPDGPVTSDTFEECIARAKAYIGTKRDGSRDNSYYRDYKYWLKEFGRE